MTTYLKLLLLLATLNGLWSCASDALSNYETENNVDLYKTPIELVIQANKLENREVK
jgi:hypothetical protein